MRLRIVVAGLVALFFAECTPGVQGTSDLGLFSFAGALSSNEFRVGGSMLGLSSSLTIAMNGGADLTLNGNGDFTFPETLTGNSIYLVTIRSQPTSPMEYCRVDGGSGIAQRDVTSVRVSCYQLPDTGQTQCTGASGGNQTCGGTPPGQDADFQDNPAALEFITVASGLAVRETASVLLWQRCPYGTTFDGANCTGTALTLDLPSAENYCTALNMEGEIWRLPTMRELLLWPHYGNHLPAAPATIFSGIPVGSAVSFWSSTRDSLAPGQYHILDSDHGETANQLPAAQGYVRCVSGPAMPVNLFSDRGNGTVYDRSTNLLWLKCPLASFGPPGVANTNFDCTGGTPPTDDWGNSLEACDGLNFAGRTDWRLPSVRELATLLDFDREATPLIDTSFFPNTPSGSFWSSTAQDFTNTNAWRVSFNNFEVRANTKPIDIYARCVTTGL